MSVEDVFIEGIRAAPYDPLPRLVYADFLEESGDPRGELIRIQCELASDHHERGDAFRAALIDRERELLAEYGDEWLAPLRALGAEGVSTACFHGGLIERIRIRAEAFLRNAEEICRIAPALASVHLRNLYGAILNLDIDWADTVIPPQITAFDLSSNSLPGLWSNAIDILPWARQAVELNLGFNHLGDNEVGLLTETEMPALRSLGLASNGIGPEGVRALAEWPALAHVEELDLSANPIGDVGLRMLCESPHVASLRKLQLASCRITSVAGPAYSERFESIVEPGLSAERVVDLAESRDFTSLERLTSLEELNLRSNRIPASAQRALAESDFGRRLKSLDVRGNPAGRGSA